MTVSGSESVYSVTDSVHLWITLFFNHMLILQHPLPGQWHLFTNKACDINVSFRTMLHISTIFHKTQLGTGVCVSSVLVLLTKSTKNTPAREKANVTEQLSRLSWPLESRHVVYKLCSPSDNLWHYKKKVSSLKSTILFAMIKKTVCKTVNKKLWGPERQFSSFLKPFQIRHIIMLIT